MSLVLHALFLAAMVLGLRVVPPPEGDRPMEVRLIEPPRTPPPPAPVRLPPTVKRPEAAAPLRPHVAPAPSPSAPPAPLAPPQAAAPAPTQPQVQFGQGGMQPSLSGKLGCDDPLTFHLTPEQRQICDGHMAQLGREAKRLVPDISDKNKADYDRYVHCQDVYKRQDVPMSGSHDDSSPIAGLGYVPSFKECPVGDR